MAYSIGCIYKADFSKQAIAAGIVKILSGQIINYCEEKWG